MLVPSHTKSSLFREEVNFCFRRSVINGNYHLSGKSHNAAHSLLAVCSKLFKIRETYCLYLSSAGLRHHC